MSDIDFGKILKGVAKGAAKVASSYIAESAKSLSNNQHFTEEARNRYGEISDSFSELRDKLYQNDCTDDDFEDSSFYDENDSFSDSICNSSSIEKDADFYISQHNQFNSIQDKTYTAPHILKQMTFAGMQWHVLKRDENSQSAILLSKDIVTKMPYSNKKESKISTLEKSSLYNWLVNEFHSNLINKLKLNDKKRLLFVSLLGADEIGQYIPRRTDRIASFNEKVEEWWLKDGKCVTINGKICGRKLSDRCGVRPVIVIKLKEKGNRI